jgi:hypothetical protein
MEYAIQYFYMGSSSIIMLLLLLLLYNIFMFMKGVLRELLDEIKKLD